MSARAKTYKVEVPTQEGEFIEFALKKWLPERGPIGRMVKFKWREHTDALSPEAIAAQVRTARGRGATKFYGALEIDAPTLEVIESWVESVRAGKAFSTDDVRVLRFAYPTKWREILTIEWEDVRRGEWSSIKPEYFSVRDRLIADARARMDANGMRLPEALKPATEAQEDAVLQKLLEATSTVDSTSGTRRVQAFIEKRKWTACRFDWNSLEERAQTIVWEDSEIDRELAVEIGTALELVCAHFRKLQPEGDGLPFAGIGELPSFLTIAKMSLAAIAVGLVVKKVREAQETA